MAGGELARRWAVALVGIPIVVVLLYWGSWPLAGAVALTAAIATDETYRLVRRKGVLPVAWLGVPASAGLVLLAGTAPTTESFAVSGFVLMGLLVLLTLVVVTLGRPVEASPLAAASGTLFGVIYGGLALAVVPILHGLPFQVGWVGSDPTAWAGVAMVALPLTATWVGDATAYFAGSAWGRHRLAPAISPKKSWEGAAAGIFGAAAGAAIWYAVVHGTLPEMPLSYPLVALIGAAIGIAAIMGDLVESMLKRDAGVKDSGTILPGHGGLLDRIDALVFTLPVSYALLRLLEALP